QLIYDGSAVVDSVVTPGDETIDQIGVYAQYETTLPGGVVALPGLRLESHSNFGEFLSPSLNLMRDISQRYRLRGFIGRGFRAPSIKEQYFEFNHSSEGYLVIGNPDLKPETSINSSLSLEISQGDVAEYRITAFYNHLNNLIEFDSVTSTPEFPVGIYEYRNIISARTRGFEFQSRWRYSEHVTLDVSYDFLDAVDLSTGARLLNHAQHTGSVLLKLQRLPVPQLSFSAWAQIEAKKLVLTRAETTFDRSETGVPKDAPVHAPIGFSIAHQLNDYLTLSGKVENLFDKTDYLLGQTEPRTVSVRLSLNTQ
ncbi:MAG TPA: TonB-dependent receptor, partial [candidate division Zixibacteria bacterium]|nr:TonB-dependent receptor [candidate division Zixibacteria bacterium]